MISGVFSLLGCSIVLARELNTICIPLVLVLLLAACSGGTGTPAERLARYDAIEFSGGRLDEYVIGGRRLKANRTRVGRPCRTIENIVVPEGGAQVEAHIAVQPLEEGHWPGVTIVWIDAVRSNGSVKRLDRLRIEVPHARWKNQWHNLRGRLPASWAGESVELVLGSEFELQPDDRPVAVYLGAPALRSGTARDPSRRDVIVVTLDTLRADMLTTWGRAGAKTPVLDQIASEGACFLEAFATTNATTPSHCSLFTSLHLREHDVRNNDQSLSLAATTMAEEFQSRGYETHAVISVRMLTYFSGLIQGFASFSGPPLGQRDGGYTVLEVAEILPEKAGVPLFLWVHLFDPHADSLDDFPYHYNPPNRHAKEFSGTEGVRGDHDAELARYRAEISKTDELLGKLLATLEAKGYGDGRLLVVAADHGECFGELGIEFKHQSLHSAVTHIPLLFQGEGVPKSFVSSDLVSMVDVLPTIYELCEFGVEVRGEGVSLVPLWNASKVHREAVYFEEVGRMAVGLRTKEWHYVRYLRDINFEDRTQRAGDEMLLRVSPGKPDVSMRPEENLEVLEGLRELLDAHLDSPITGLTSGRAEHSSSTRSELEAMGYTASDD